jgi:hypothetical protein
LQLIREFLDVFFKFEEIPSTFTSYSKTWHIMAHHFTVSSNVHRFFPVHRVRYLDFNVATTLESCSQDRGTEA